MSDDKQGQDQLSTLFSQRFKDRESAPTEQPVGSRRRRGNGAGRQRQFNARQYRFSCCRNSPSGSTMRTMRGMPAYLVKLASAAPNSAKWCLKRACSRSREPVGSSAVGDFYRQT